MSTRTIPKRSEVAPEHTWDLTLIYPDDDQWEQDFQRVEAMVAQVEAFRGRLGESGATLLAGLRLRDELHQRFDQVMVYARMRRDEDNTNNIYQGLTDRASSLATRVAAAGSFFEPELLSIADERLDSFLAADTDLAGYRHHLDELRRQRAHIRSVEVEEVLAQAGEIGRVPGTVFTMLNNADLTFPTIIDEHGEAVELTKGRYVRFLESQDGRVRREAFETLYATYGKLKNTIGATLASSIKRDIFFARSHRHESSLAAALDADNIPRDVYHNLIAAVDAHLPHLHRYLRLRRRLLGLDELHMWDLYVPMIPEARHEVPYSEAVELAIKALHPLGDDYLAVMTAGLRHQRWIDVYENQGKTSGGYSSGCYTTQPYILINYQDSLDDVFTLVHELGHSMHSHYSRISQPYIYAYYTIFIAEVASTLNEALLTHFLLKTTSDRRVRMALINRYLEQIRTTIYRQTMFADFELRTHAHAEAGGALTPDWFSAEYKALNDRYYGPEVVVDEGIALEWSRIPHFYRAFYVFQYATGLSAAIALAETILRDGPPAITRYLKMLRGGSADYSINLLKEAGVDMTTPTPVAQALATFGRLVDEMEQLSLAD